MEAGGGKTELFAQGLDFVGGLGAGPGGDDLQNLQGVLILEPDAVLLKTGIGGQLLPAHGPAQTKEFLRRRGGQGGQTVVGTEEGVGGTDALIAVARRLHALAGQLLVRPNPVHDPHDVLRLGHLDELSPTGLPSVMKGGQDGYLAHEAAVIITDPDGLLQGRALGEAGHPGVSGQGLRSPVIGGTVLLGVEAPLAEAVFLDINDAGIYLLDLLIADIPASGYPGTEIEFNDVCLGRQFLEDLLSQIDMKVEGHVILVGVDVHEHGRLFFVEPAEGIERSRYVSDGG